FYETISKINHKFIPPLDHKYSTRRLINEVFYRKDDYKWVQAIPDQLWEKLIHQLEVLCHFDCQNREDKNLNSMISSIQILSHRIAALGTEHEITDKLPHLDEVNSPFLQQNKEVTLYLDSFDNATELNNEDYNHLVIILDQCLENLRILHRRRNKFGTSLRLTYLVGRLQQQINRLKTLLILIHQKDTANFRHYTILLFKELVQAENEKTSLRRHLHDNTNLVAYQVAEHSARTGVSYIAQNKKEFFKFFRKSLGGGIIVALFAIIKITLSRPDLSPFGEAVVFSLNYVMAFVLIYITNSTLATTQPAMTASAIAESMEGKAKEGKISMNNLASLVVKIHRTQFISFLGNLLMAVPVAYLLTKFYTQLFGHQLAGFEKATKILEDIHPWESASIFYAAIAGLFLFLAGLVSGYYDNKVVYSRIPARLKHMKTLKKLLGTKGIETFANYIEYKLGNLMGYIFLGIAFGSLTVISNFFGIHLEFRHITFSAGNFGISMAILNAPIFKEQVLLDFMSVLIIGLVNFFVSFGLALWVGIRARKVSFRQRKELFRIIGLHAVKFPQDFFFAPNKERLIRPEQKSTPEKAGREV
ncbi:MAG: site-specific recombinase, partial [Bacteroidales bacterium]|nr:site-specific recombinase [Bacteroidales bacterium]